VENRLPEDFHTFTSLETIESCLTHLIRNAIESYPEETPAEERKIQIVLDLLEEEGEREVEIRVCDRGTGIPQSVRENLFDPFISTKNSVGRGFGLTIVKHSISHLNGGVSVGPNPSGEGTCATLRFPAENE
jgi:signal transduction histidine kinase